MLGTLRLPLVLLASGDASAAAGTNIAISTASAASGSVAHAREGRVEWAVVAWMAPPSVVGAVLGGLFGHRVPEGLLLGAIAAVLAWNGVDLVARPFREHAYASMLDGRGQRLLIGALLGFVIGILGGAIGVILGTLRMPALLRAVGLTAHRAVGTNLVVGVALGLFGFLAHVVRLEVEWDLVAAGLVGALPGGWLGARFTGRLSEQTLRRAIGVALLVIAAAFAVELGARVAA